MFRLTGCRLRLIQSPRRSAILEKPVHPKDWTQIHGPDPCGADLCLVLVPGRETLRIIAGSISLEKGIIGAAQASRLFVFSRSSEREYGVNP